MIVATSEKQLREELAKIRGATLDTPGKSIALVPTMGFLHPGHLSLVKLGRRRAKAVCATIFVNPTQFNDKRDYEAYPIDLENDKRMLQSEGVDLLFAPPLADMYGPQFQSWVSVAELSKPHEGEFRPGHFRGVTTIVAMLFNLAQPDFAVFGEKDFQQLRQIEQMVEDLKFPIEIIRGPLVRESDGLAMSSRNVRLGEGGRQSALLLSRGLMTAEKLFLDGERKAERLIAAAQSVWARDAGVQEQYAVIADERSLMTVSEISTPCRFLLAAFVDGVRLIDNIVLHPK